MKYAQIVFFVSFIFFDGCSHQKNTKPGLHEIDERDFNYAWTIGDAQRYMSGKCMDSWVDVSSDTIWSVIFAGVKYRSFIGCLEYTYVRGETNFRYLINNTAESYFNGHRDTANVLPKLTHYTHSVFTVFETYFSSNYEETLRSKSQGIEDIRYTNGIYDIWLMADEEASVITFRLSDKR